MKYLIDTCTVSHFVKGHSTISSTLKTTDPQLISISSISVMEIEYGLKLNLERARSINSIIENLLLSINVLSFDTADAEVAGSIRARLKKQGNPVGPYDLLIAAQALRHGLILVTQNTNEFKRIPALIIEDWLA